MGRTWPRSVQLGLLCGLGLAFVGVEREAVGGGECPTEGECTYKKPNLAFVVESSTAMTEDFVAGQTRWEATLEAIASIVQTDNGFFDETFHLALVRFGHDPAPAIAGTLGDGGLVDGTAVDVAWYDAVLDPAGYFQCNGQAVVDALQAVGPPCDGVACSPMYAWTTGGLARARAEVAQTRLDHPDDVIPGEERLSLVMLWTTGAWTTADGSAPADPDTDPDNPVFEAEALHGADGVPVYVVALGDAAGTVVADAVALAGGTAAALDLATGEPQDALEQVIDDVESQAASPDCTDVLPRILFVLDASSSMLNVGDATVAAEYQAGAMGQTPWDLARGVMEGIGGVGVPELYNQPLEDLTHVGLLAFGNDGHERVVVPYASCTEDAIAWATDPQTSCAAGCADPWGGPPITWTFQSGAEIPCFAIDATSVMPLCEQEAAGDDACSGSAKVLHVGLAAANAYAQEYAADPPEPLGDAAPFVHILLTDGRATGESTDAQVSAELVDMYANDGITTLVVGVGDDVDDAVLDPLACWGSGGTGIPCTGGAYPPFTAATLGELHDALTGIASAVPFDPCCWFNDCSFFGHDTGTCDPSGGPDTSTSDAVDPTSDASSMGDSGTSGDSTGDASSGGPPDDTSGPDPGGTTTTSTTADPPPGDTARPPGGSTGEIDTDDVGSTDPGGCSCAAFPRASGASVLSLLLLAWRRRRSRALGPS